MAIGNPITLTSNVASKTISVIATAGQTLFTVTGGYRINQLAVFRNGVRLLDSRDYEARNGATVTLLSAATVGDALEFQVFDDFRVADAIVSAESEQTISGNLIVSGILTATDLRGSDVTFRHVKATGISTVSDTTQTTSTTTGALVVSGGVGIAKSLFVGGDMQVAGTLSYEDVTNTETAGITTTGGLVVTGLGATFGSGVGIADSIYHIGDDNTAIRFPAADTFTVETGGDEALRVDSSQRLLVNIDSAMETFGSAALQVATTAGGTLVLGRNDTSVSADNGLGAIYFDTKAGGSYAESAVIAAEADADQGSSDYPSRLVFKTTADGASSVTERLRIDSSGTIKYTGVRTGDETNKLGRFIMPSHDTNEEDVMYFQMQQEATFNQLELGGGSATYNAATQILFRTAAIDTTTGTERLRIDSSGNIGINKTPSAKLDIKNGSDAAVIVSIEGADSSSEYLGFGIGSGEAIITAGGNGSTSNALVFKTAPSGTETERLRIDSAGDMGLGVSPNNVGSMRTLHIKGPSSEGAAIRLQDNGDTADSHDFQIYKNSSAAYLRVNGTDPLRFYLNGADRALIDSSGRLLINTDTSRIVEDSVGNGPQGLIQIEAADSSAIMSIISAGTNDANRCGTINLGRHRNSNVGGTPTIVNNGDALGSIVFSGGDGTDMRTRGATIIAACDGSPAENQMPTRLLFGTNAGSGSVTERLRIDSVGTFNFNNGMMIESVNINSTAKNGTQNVDLQDGMVHYFSTNSTGTWKSNFRVNSGKNVNGLMSTGDVISPTMIVAKGATSHYADTIQIDGSDVTPEWLGGAPTDGGGSGTFDVYSYTIIKTGDGAFKVFGSVSNYE